MQRATGMTVGQLFGSLVREAIFGSMLAPEREVDDYATAGNGYVNGVKVGAGKTFDFVAPRPAAPPPPKPPPCVSEPVAAEPRFATLTLNIVKAGERYSGTYSVARGGQEIATGTQSDRDRNIVLLGLMEAAAAAFRLATEVGQ